MSRFIPIYRGSPPSFSQICGGSHRQFGFRANLTTKEVRHWFDQRKPVWSPDGEQLVYWAEGDDLWIMKRDGTNQQRLTEGLDIVEVLWSPEGSNLAIATYSQLWIIERPAR